MFKRITKEELEAGRTEKGAFTRKQLAAWGVPWPPPKGWKRALLGLDSEEGDNLEKMQADPAILLDSVVRLLIDRGHGSLLSELPAVTAFYGGKLPTVEEVIGFRPAPCIVTGSIEFDDRVYEFKCAKRNSTHPVGI